MTDKELVEHYKIYLLAWQRARSMLVREQQNKDRTATEKEIMRELFNTMTESLNEEIKKIL